MKIPKINVFWNSVASPFLTLMDLATLELAIDNRDERRNLMLPIPIDETQPGDDELPPYFNPYDTLYSLNTNEFTELTSEEMRIWCERRHILTERIQLKYMPSFERIEGSSPTFDLFHHVLDLEIDEITEQYHMIKKLFPKLYSLKKFCVWEDSVTEAEVYALVRQVNINVTRGKDIYPGPCQLEDLKLHIGELAPKALKYLIGNLTTIKKIMFAFPGSLKDDLLELMALRWPSLKYIDICNARIHDSAFETFRRTRQRFEYVQLVDIEDLTANGVRNLLWNSGPTLQELSLCSMLVNEKEMMILLQNCPALKVLKLDYMSDCSAIIIRTISKRCANLIQLKLNKLDDSDKIRDADIQALVQGCPKITKLHLTYFPSLTPKCVEMIDTAYAKQITKFWINDRKFMQRCRRTQFSTCPNRLSIEREEDFDDD